MVTTCHEAFQATARDIRKNKKLFNYPQ